MMRMPSNTAPKGVGTSTARLNCLCGAVSDPGTLLAESELPIFTETCHCNSCRHSTGVLGASFPRLNSAPSQDTLARLTPYHSSKDITRYFCSTCGCHCFISNHKFNRWTCLGGIIDQNYASQIHAASNPWPVDIIKISYHDFVLDTIDGGLAPLLLNLNGRSIPTWSAGGPESPPPGTPFDLPHEAVLSLPRKSKAAHPEDKDSAYLPAKCHCGGVSLLIKRANFTSASNPHDPLRYIPSDPKKYLAHLCSCASCRLATGSSLVPWALVPPSSVFYANPASPEANLQPLVIGFPSRDKSANPGLTLKHHWSAPDTCWSFCGTCGATMFYWSDERPGELDLAVGVLRSEDGSMARNWLQWDWGRCCFGKDCVDAETYEAWLTSPEVMARIGG